MEKRYEAVKNYRMARRENGVILFNAYNEACIELDRNSEKIFAFIESERPCMSEIINFGEKMGIVSEETEAFLLCLEETEFIYEDKRIS